MFLATTPRCGRGRAMMRAYLQLRNSLLDLLDLHLAETFDLEKRLACGSVDRLNSLSKLGLCGKEYWRCPQQQCSSHWP